MANWRDLITQAMKTNNETFADVEAKCACLNDWQIDKPILFTDDDWFAGGYGGTNGVYFTVWTLDTNFAGGYGGTNGVYFTVWTIDKPILFTDDDWLDTNYGGTNGVYFTVWTKDHVYFHGCYDGTEFVDFISRNPNNNPTEHIGG